jgi:hypothetical protein
MSPSRSVSGERGISGGVIDHTVSAGTAARIAASVPEATRRAYAGDWERFTTWCATAGRSALPASPETLAEYVSALADAGKAPATITQAVASIRTAHRINQLTPPTPPPPAPSARPTAANALTPGCPTNAKRPRWPSPSCAGSPLPWTPRRPCTCATG